MEDLNRKISKNPGMGKAPIKQDAPLSQDGLSSLHEDDFRELIINDQNSPDISVKRSLSFSDILIAYDRMQKARISRKSLPSDNTRLTYASSLEALRNHDRSDDGRKSPFRGFDAIKDELAKSSYYVRRSALIDHALSILQAHTKSVLMMMAMKARQQAVAEALRGMQEDDTPTPQTLSTGVLHDYEEAVRFLKENAPALGTQADRSARIRKGMAEADEIRKMEASLGLTKQRTPKASKKQTLRKVMDTERKYPERGHFRDRMFSLLAHAPDSMKPEVQEKIALLSVMTLAGPRPNELIKGVQLHYIEPSEGYDKGRILIRIEGSKVSSFEDQEIGLSDIEMTEQQQSLWQDIKDDPASRDFYRKGQDYRYVEVAVTLPQAEFLADLISKRTKGKTPIQSQEALLLNKDPEQNTRRDINSEISSSLALRFPGFLPPAERDDPDAIRRGVDKLSKMVQRLGAKIYRGKEKITPYVFRHAFSADIKAHYDGEDLMISAGLGHAVDRTKGAYAPRGSAPKLRASYIVTTSSSKPVSAKLSRSYRGITPKG